MKIRVSLFTALYSLGAALVAAPADGAFRFLGPSPYLSTADSPFDLSGLGSTFFLEDFEDSNIAPGVIQLPDGFELGLLGSSVDADDGLIDGSGQQGHSFSVNGGVDGGSFSTVFIEFEFDANVLGFLPTAVGYVLTDGGGPLSAVTAFDAMGGFDTFNTEQLVLSPSTTSDDRFIGVENPTGISRIVISKTDHFFDSLPFGPFPVVDHLQYGLGIPEPSTNALFALGAISWIIGGKMGIKLSCFLM
jgi:hypothetical protein